MARAFEAKPQKKVVSSSYSYCDNDVNGKFGTARTASGVDIDRNEYTAAVPTQAATPGVRGSKHYHQDDPYQIGDILLVERNKRQVLVVVTDVGTLPNAAVDLARGVATWALLPEGNDPKGGATGRSTTVTKVASVRTGSGMPDAERLRAAMRVVKRINHGERPMSHLFTATLGVGGPQMVTELASNIASIDFTAPGVQTPASDPVLDFLDGLFGVTASPRCALKKGPVKQERGTQDKKREKHSGGLHDPNETIKIFTPENPRVGLTVYDFSMGAARQKIDWTDIVSERELDGVVDRTGYDRGLLIKALQNNATQIGTLHPWFRGAAATHMHDMFVHEAIPVWICAAFRGEDLQKAFNKQGRSSATGKSTFHSNGFAYDVLFLPKDGDISRRQPGTRLTVGEAKMSGAVLKATRDVSVANGISNFGVDAPHHNMSEDTYSPHQVDGPYFKGGYKGNPKKDYGTAVLWRLPLMADGFYRDLRPIREVFPERLLQTSLSWQRAYDARHGTDYAALMSGAVAYPKIQGALSPDIVLADFEPPKMPWLPIGQGAEKAGQNRVERPSH